MDNTQNNGSENDLSSKVPICDEDLNKIEEIDSHKVAMRDKVNLNARRISAIKDWFIDFGWSRVDWTADWLDMMLEIV